MSRWIYRDGADEAPSLRQARGDPKQRHELLVLSLVLSIGVVGWNYLVHLWIGAADHQGLAAVDHGVRDAVLSLPMAFAAVGAGQWLARRLGLTGTGPLHALNRASVISLVFAVLLIPSVSFHHVIDGYLDGAAPHTGGGLEHDTSPAGLVLHGVREAMIGQAVGLPLLFAAIALLSGGMAARRTKSAELSMGTIRHGARKVKPVRPRRIGSRLARHAIPALVAVTTCIALAGGFVAFRIVSDNANTHFADGRVSTSFGAVWVDSFKEIAIPKTVHKGHIGIPQGGSPDKVALEVTVRLANTTAAPVELTPARFALRLGPNGKPISVEGAAFESVRLLPAAIFDARMQFPVEGGEHRLSLLFDDPDGSGPIAIDLGQARFQDTAGKGNDDHDH